MAKKANVVVAIVMVLSCLMLLSVFPVAAKRKPRAPIAELNPQSRTKEMVYYSQARRVPNTPTAELNPQSRTKDVVYYPQARRIPRTPTLNFDPKFDTKEMVYYPQGCRCCYFIWKPTIRCGDVCCGDGCTCT